MTDEEPLDDDSPTEEIKIDGRSSAEQSVEPEEETDWDTFQAFFSR